MARTLSQDVRWLGDTLGDVLRAHGGETLFDSVERMRRAAKRARDADAENQTSEAEIARRELADVAAELPAQDALDVARAFTLYFQLVNQAEDVHRTRELRRRERSDGVKGVAESLPATVAELRRRGATDEELMAALGDVRLGFVFTAHPTEARRRTTERLLSDVRRVLEHHDRRAMTPTEEKVEARRLRATIEALWEHAAERAARPDVLEEVKTGLWYLRNVLFDAVPRLQRRLAAALEVEPDAVDPFSLPSPIYFGSWMGADRDGNPYVTDAVMERTLELQHWIALDRYVKDLDALVDPLAAAAHRLPAMPALDDALARAAQAVPEAALLADRRNPREPLRRLLTFMRARLERTRNFSAGAYPRPEAFLEDLQVVRDSLLAANATALPNDRLLDLMLRVRCFGFVLARLDVREDSRVHRRIVGELLNDPGYAEKSDAERIEALKHLHLPPPESKPSPEARRLLDLFDTISRLQARFGRDAIGTYVISMTESPADVLEVLRLAELHGLADRLDVVPLLETRSALANAERLLSGLFTEETYREHVRARGDRQELLVGYSDSMKEAGILGSRVAVLEAQRIATEVCDAHGVRLRVFHGRGGSVSRGGGPTYRAIRALPRAVFSGDTKVTEQGEVRSFHFSNPDLAVRYLEQTLGAALVVRYEARHAPRDSWVEEAQTLKDLAARGVEAYRALVELPELVPFFEEATPFAAIAALNIASRPAKRRSGALSLSDLRAIPWVFSWSQCRMVITGWYGVGYAISKMLDTPHGAEKLRALHARAPFFRDLIDNVEMTLAKADLHIGARYAELCKDPKVREAILEPIRAEATRTHEGVLRLSEAKHLLEDDSVLRTSIELRNPYVDPLSYLQIEALQRSRGEASEATAAWEEVARVAVYGIAAGLRNTG